MRAAEAGASVAVLTKGELLEGNTRWAKGGLAAVINAARGGHLVEDDLLEALASGQISGATLDVFHEEPLPADHPFRAHPRVIVTPHAASLTIPEPAARYIVKSMAKARAGQALDNVVGLARGY